MSNRNKLVGWFVAIVVIIAAVTGLVYRSVQGFIADARWVSHTHEVLDTLSATMVLLADAESGQRGYTITGRTAFLEPYHAAHVQIASNLQRLQSLSAEDAARRESAQQLAAMVGERLQIMQRTVEARSQSFEAAQQSVLSDDGRQLTNRIRERIGRMEADARLLLGQRYEAAQQSARRTVAAGGFGVLLALIIMLIMLQDIRSEGRQRELAEAQLRAGNTELARSLEDVQRLGREQAAMGAMAELLQSCRSLDEARPVIRRALDQILPGEPGAICLMHPSQNFLEVAIEWEGGGDRAAGTQSTFAPDQCWALRRGRLHVVDDTHAGLLCTHLAPASPPSYVCVPMMAQGETLGIMFVQRDHAGANDDDRLRRLRAVSEQLALALANLKLQESLRIQSIRDPLTGLFNRRYLEASMEREFARARRNSRSVCLLMLDVDHFKRFNDTFGHEAGDAVLAEFAGVLKSCSRDEDIACRYGGEEFALILPETTPEKARERAEHIRAQTARLHLEHRRRSLGSISVSIGVAAYPDDGATVDGLIHAADAALYQSKQAGRDRVTLASAPTA